MNQTPDRVCVFVDGGNLFHAGRKLGIRIDHVKLKDILAGKRKLIRPYYYGATKDEPGQNRFYDRLRYGGFEVRTLPLREYDGEQFEKGIDVMLVTDMLVLAHKGVYDVAILVAGDKDYTYTVRALKEMGIRVEVACFDHAFAKELRLSADQATSLNQLADQIRRDDLQE